MNQAATQSGASEKPNFLYDTSSVDWRDFITEGGLLPVA